MREAESGRRNGSADFWLRMQMAYDLSRVRMAENEINVTPMVAKAA